MRYYLLTILFIFSFVASAMSQDWKNWTRADVRNEIRQSGNGERKIITFSGVSLFVKKASGVVRYYKTKDTNRRSLEFTTVVYEETVEDAALKGGVREKLTLICVSSRQVCFLVGSSVL